MSEPSPQYTVIAVAVGMFVIVFCVGMAALGWSASRAARAQAAAEQEIFGTVEEAQRDAARQIEEMERQERERQEMARMEQQAREQAREQAGQAGEERVVAPSDPAGPTTLKADSAVTSQGDVEILGALTADLVTAVIKRNMAQLRYCYQRELTRDPDLAGKVTVKFVIAKDGAVSSASVDASTLGSAAVESCLTGRFMRFQFPQPTGGGIVVVRYPLVFSPG